MPSFVDDKAPICIPFIRERLNAHRSDNRTGKPLVVGLNGVQGAGKTTLVAPLAAALRSDGINTLVCSIDDFYLTHDDQLALAANYPDNALLQHRGEPGTHEVQLAKQILDDIVAQKPTQIPQYDKAAFAGQGDRLPESAWKKVNQAGDDPVQVVILEGWCVGFRPIGTEDVEAKWNATSRTLGKHKLEHLVFINDRLKEYEGLTEMFDAFVHIDAEDPQYVYAWRQEQEDWLRIERGDATAGMTPEQVVTFVDGYYPAYELYTDTMRDGVLPGREGCQLRMIVGRDRKVKQVVTI